METYIMGYLTEAEWDEACTLFSEYYYESGMSLDSDLSYYEQLEYDFVCRHYNVDDVEIVE